MLPTRLIVGVMIFLGFAMNYLLRANMNFAIITMVDYHNGFETDTLSNHLDSYYEAEQGNNNLTSYQCFLTTLSYYHHPNEPKFHWTSFEQSQVIGSFYYGYASVQIFGGIISDRCGGKRIIFTGLLLASFLTLILPFAAKYFKPDQFPYGVVVVRALIGASEGLSFPATKSLLCNWTCEREKSLMTILVYTGCQFGTIMAYAFSGYISKQFGWEYIFYFLSISTFIWLVIWSIAVQDSPQTHPWTSPEEKELLIKPKTRKIKLSELPWKDIIKSRPFWAIFVANFANNWVYHLLMAEIPTYLRTILQLQLTNNTFYSLLPYSCMIIFTLLNGYVSHYLINNGFLTTLNSRKLSNTIAHMGPAICLLIMVFIDCSYVSAHIALLTLSVMFNGALYGGFVANVLDIAPNFAATIFGFTNAIGSINGALAPLTAAAFTRGQPSVLKWRPVWLLTFAILSVESIFYLCFASSKQEYWNDSPDEEKETYNVTNHKQRETINSYRSSINSCGGNDNFDAIIIA